jgi:organic radical activating enzyme
MPKGQISQERNKSAERVAEFKNYKDLPLVSTGCDSYASWASEFKHLSPMVEIDGIVDSIMGMLPHKEWRDEHLVITGGEPLLGWQRAYPDLLFHDKMVGLTEITFETNGTQHLTPEFKQALLDWNKVGREITFSVSPKLSVSGEKWSDAIKPEIVSEYQEVDYVYLKFVVATEEDAQEAEQAVKEYRKMGFNGPVYLMPVGGTTEKYQLNTRRVAELAMHLGWRYSARLQCDLFKNQWGT